jgi:hypothetical protein
LLAGRVGVVLVDYFTDRGVTAKGHRLRHPDLLFKAILTHEGRKLGIVLLELLHGIAAQEVLLVFVFTCLKVQQDVIYFLLFVFSVKHEHNLAGIGWDPILCMQLIFFEYLLNRILQLVLGMSNLVIDIVHLLDDVVFRMTLHRYGEPAQRTLLSLAVD